MEMMQYRPWKKEEVKSIISSSNEKLPILDIQLGGACNLHCIYCDTPKYGFPCSVNLSAIEKLMKDGDVKWVYVCGLGEPTAPANLRHLKQILEWCKEKKIGLSMFSNVLNLDDELLEYIDNDTLHILFKLDSFKADRMAYLFGTTIDKAQKMKRNYAKLLEVTHAKNGVTNLGTSIVPTSVNYDEMTSLINWCMNHGVFPLIGQLEDAGSCSKIYQELEVKEEDLMKFRNYLSNNFGVNYEMPICPATISGIHITNTNNIILDEKTGLSCPWFWLGEPKIKAIGNINDMSYDEIVKKILEYRNSKFNDVVDMEKHIELYPFGGCGGNVKQLLRTYIDASKRK